MIVCISIFHVNQLLHYQIAHYLTFAQIFDSLLVKAELFGSKSVLTQLLTVSNVSVNVDAICFLRYVIQYRSQTKSNSEPNDKSNDLRYSLQARKHAMVVSVMMHTLVCLQKHNLIYYVVRACLPF